MRATATKALTLLILTLGTKATTAEPFKVMSFNILADILDDSFGDWNFDPAGPRRDRVGAIFAQEDADLIGLQEVDDSQYPDLISILPGYDNVRVGWNAIFYKVDRFQLLDNGDFDYSTHDGRFAVWAKLLDNSTNQPFVMFGTHLSHNNSDYRLTQAADMQAAIPTIAGDLAVVLTGDFNFPPHANFPQGLVTEHLLEITGRTETQNRLLVDACIPLCGGTGSSSKRIDYVVNSDNFQVTNAQVVTTLVDSLRPSDHRPVTAELTYNPVGSRRTRWAVQSHIVSDYDFGNGFDGLGNTLRQSIGNPKWAVGRNGVNDSKFIIKFTVPEDTESSPAIEAAILRIHVSDLLGELPGGLSLMHSAEDNEYQISTADYQSPYADTGLDLIVSAGGTGQYYEFDVTSFVLADQLADGANPLAAFRLELPEAPEYGVDAAYYIDTKLSAPQLVITFVPEPTTSGLALIATLCLAIGRRRR